MKRRKGWRISCDVGEAMEGLENEALPQMKTIYVNNIINGLNIDNLRIPTEHTNKETRKD